MPHVSRAVLPALLMAFPALGAAEDLTIISRVTVGKEAPITTTQYVTANKVRTSNGETDTIFDVTTGTMWVVNHKKKEYVEFNRDEMAAMVQPEQQLSAAALDILAQMGGVKKTEVAVKKAGATRKIAGYDCEPYEVTFGDNIEYELCAAPALASRAPYFDALKGHSILGPLGGRLGQPLDAMKKIEGFPLAMSSSIDLMVTREEFRSEATEVKKGPIAASVFVVPAGFRKEAAPVKK